MTFRLGVDDLFGDFRRVADDVETRLCDGCTRGDCVALLKLAAGMPVLQWDLDIDGAIVCAARTVTV